MIERIASTDVTFGGMNPVDYCRLPYPKHPEGCPNVDALRPLDGLKTYLKPWIIRECPSNDLTKNILIDQIFDMRKPLYLIMTEYPVGRDAEYQRTHSQKLKTVAQWYNIRYWQDRARRKLYDEVENFLIQDTSILLRGQFNQMSPEELRNQTIVDLCPEAHGVKIIPTAMHVGTHIRFGKWPPTEHDPSIVRYQVAVGGYPKDPEFLIARGSLGRIK